MKVILAAVLFLSACSGKQSKAEQFTLYRNSPYAVTRVHWATFDANESDPSYNSNNCHMAARLLNENLIASARQQNLPPHADVGFWCEPGAFKETGAIPAAFEHAFPTDV